MSAAEGGAWRSRIMAGASAAVSVPASTGNVGPGFDSMGLALEHRDSVRLTVLEEGLEFELDGEGSESVPRTEDHLLVRSVRAAWAAAGVPVQDQPGMRIEARNRVPHGRGMGSSAACAVSGVVAANALLLSEHRLDDDAVLQVSASMEGHPDNVAPALHGGLTISWGEPGVWRTAPVAVDPSIIPIVAIPNYEVSTALARSLLPETVAHGDAAHNAGRAALLVDALTRRPQHLLAATDDRLHQPFRAPAMPPSAQLVARLREQGHAALISGAGPTVLILAPSVQEADAAEQAVAEASAAPAAGGEHVTWRVLRLSIPTEGATLSEHPQSI